jgi:putative Mg2+ transporter-C (MgtC) family protein
VNDPYLEIALRLGAAWLAGCLIGLERTLHGRPAGFRTFGLITTASAMLMVFTFYQTGLMGRTPPDVLRIDPQRIAQGIMTGIGFIGAGVVFKEGLTVHGLTTAATVWAAAALGIIIGAGFWWPSALGFAIVLLTLAVLKWVEDRLPRLHVASVRMRYDRKGAPDAEGVRGLLEGAGLTIKELNHALDSRDQQLEYRLVVCTRDLRAIERLAGKFCAMPDLRGFEFSPSDE